MKKVSLEIEENSVAYSELVDLIKKYLGEYVDNILIESEIEKE